MALTTFDTLDEGTTPIYSTVLKDENGVALTGLPFTGVRLSYYSTLTGTIINSRTNQNILNANNVTIDGAGLLKWKLQEADVVLTDGATVPSVVRCRAEIVIEWLDADSVPRQIAHDLEIPIRRLVKRPFAP